MINVTKTFFPEKDSYNRLLDEIWSSSQLTNAGPLSKRLIVELSDFLTVSNLQLLANGTLALQMAIRALGLSGEIITTPYSYVATTNAILWEGCKPIFVDISPTSFCINPDLIEAAITTKTQAILATHVYGVPCDVESIKKIADKYNLKVIYDAAHAFGVRLNGRPLLNFGDCSTLSFHATKLFHTGEGGATVSRNADVANKIALLSAFGHLGEDVYLDVGINAKLSELHAAMGLAVLPHVADLIKKRRQVSEWYDQGLSESRLQRLSIPPEVEYNFAYYPVIFNSHEQMIRARDQLNRNNIFPRRYFYPSLNKLPFLDADLKIGCPVSEDTAQRVLCLPLSYDLREEAVEHISNIINMVLS